ncbi:PrsW family intramembrane metalloprotease [Capillibacterium thermochitinicola]|uniref:Protease PrsW n=1 Tax=Capillibacterium thermochitinicola TaxID=2699427 RepID=A0A8J6LMQ9_9FIRM|nr:PrsW family glutamic-type intramembrane protease [Capillibacterium thermochitinicola]MBA2134029.1 PrsW family intramembrane metalloprotease [Capillibacterium thermochitinicola]
MLVPHLLVSILPGVLWLVFFYRKDRHEPEPKRVIARVFLGGMFMVVPAGALEFLGKDGLTIARGSGDLGLIFLYAFLYIGLIEEGLKFLLLALTVNYRKDMNEPVDGIVYGITVGLGFAALENLLYTRTMGFEVGIWRAVVTCLAHATFSGWGGYFLTAGGAYRSVRQRFFRGFGVALFWHGLYDFFIFLNTPFWSAGALVLTGILLYFLFRKMHELEAASPFNN